MKVNKMHKMKYLYTFNASFFNREEGINKFIFGSFSSKCKIIDPSKSIKIRYI
jgi:hypothetical protein